MKGIYHAISQHRRTVRAIGIFVKRMADNNEQDGYNLHVANKFQIGFSH